MQSKAHAVLALGCALLCSVCSRKHTFACAPQSKRSMVQCVSGAQTTSYNQNTVGLRKLY
jgi:hypothetical protein